MGISKNLLGGGGFGQNFKTAGSSNSAGKFKQGASQQDTGKLVSNIQTAMKKIRATEGRTADGKEKLLNLSRAMTAAKIRGQVDINVQNLINDTLKD